MMNHFQNLFMVNKKEVYFYSNYKQLIQSDNQLWLAKKQEPNSIEANLLVIKNKDEFKLMIAGTKIHVLLWIKVTFNENPID